MSAFTGFEEVTGECLASCGGDSIDGHTEGCELGPALIELAALQEQVRAKAEADKLLKEAFDIFSGELSLCDDPNTQEWIWKFKVRYYFEDTDIPPHELPADMKGGEHA